MGRYLLIEFDEAESAVKLKKQVDQAARSGKSFRVIGYYASPEVDMSCECDPDSYTFNRGRPYSPSKQVHKTGWTKCLDCGKYRQHYIMMKNLLAPEKIIKPPLHKMREYFTKKIANFYHYNSSIIIGQRMVKEEHE